MRFVPFALALAALTAGCDSSVQTFGKSYDECILKNARDGGDRASRETATAICERRFSRAATKSDRQRIRVATNVFIIPNAADYVQIGVEAPADIVVLEARSEVSFYWTAAGRDRRDSSDFIETFTWDSLQPYADAWTGLPTATGSFPDRNAPSAFWTAKTVPTKVLTLGSN